MKQLIIIIFVFAYLHLFSQQSKSFEYRPVNSSAGFVNNSKSAVLISNVPAYLWQRGCGPTAVGMVVGYYDNIGYSELIQGSAVTQTSYVNSAIAGDDHYNDYSLPLDYYPNLSDDKSVLGGAHVSNCIADFMNTSWSSRNNYWGWSWSSDIDNSFTDFVNFQYSAYLPSASNTYYSDEVAWTDFKNEINNQRPVVLLVDSDGDGGTDHFVTGIGYDETGKLFAIYDTWDTEVHWFDWHGLINGNDWGIWGFTKFGLNASVNITGADINEILIFPNPVSDKLFIKNINNYKNLEIKISDLFGRVVLCEFIKNSAVDFSNIKSGIYFVELWENNELLYKNKIVSTK